MKFKLKNIVLVSLLAVAGILGISSALVEKGATSDTKQADAAAFTRTIYLDKSNYTWMEKITVSFDGGSTWNSAKDEGNHIWSYTGSFSSAPTNVVWRHNGQDAGNCWTDAINYSTNDKHNCYVLTGRGSRLTGYCSLRGRSYAIGSASGWSIWNSNAVELTYDNGNWVGSGSFAKDATFKVIKENAWSTDTLWYGWSNTSENDDQARKKGQLSESETNIKSNISAVLNFYFDNSDNTIYIPYVSRTVTFDGNGSTSGSMSNQSIILKQDTSLTSNAYTKTGYKFQGWAESSSGSVVYTDGKTVNFDNSSTLPLYAKWNAKQASITFNKNGGTGGSDAPASKATYDSAMPTGGLTAPTRNGYTFGGYYDGSGGTGTQYYTSSMTSARTWNKNTESTTTLYAKWTKINYTITVDLDGGEGASNKSYSISATAQTVALDTPTKSGYDFAGYIVTTQPTTGTATVTGTPATTLNIPADSYGAITVEAQWSEGTYTITYNTNGGSGDAPASQTPAVGSTVTFATYSGTKTGYTFAGWNTNSSGTGDNYTAGGTGTPATAKGGTLELYAKWTINSHTLTWNFNGGTATGFSPASGSSVNYGATITYPNSITKTGYNFGGYSTSVTSMPDNDLTITASWTAKTTTVTLDRQSGTGGSSGVTATYGSAMPSITVPTRDGFTFGGYYTSTGGSGTQYYTSSGASARNWNFEDSTKTLYAKWTAKSYTITFNQNDGTGTSYTDTKTGGTAYTIPTPEELGHTASGGRHFLRWATNSDGTGTSYAAGASYTTNADLNLYLIQDWYTYQYRINGGTWHTLTYKNPSDPTNYVREYYPEESIDLVTGDKITFQRYYGSGDPEAIGGTITWEGNYDGTDGVTYGVTGQFYLKVRNNGDYNCWVPGESTTFGVIITRGGKDLYFPTTYSDGQYISGYISIQSGDVVKGKYTTGDAYSLTLNEYSQGHWNSTGPTATAAGVYKFYLQSLDSVNYNIVYISMNDQASAIFFAQNFNSTIGGICKMDGSTNKSSLTSAWGLTDASGLYKNYSLLTDEAKDYLVDTSENEDIIAFFQKYDYVLGKYGTGVVGNFLSRSVTPKASFNNYTINSLFGEDNFSTIIIIISSSVALLSVTALSILVIRKRKSKEIE